MVCHSFSLGTPHDEQHCLWQEKVDDGIDGLVVNKFSAACRDCSWHENDVAARLYLIADIFHRFRRAEQSDFYGVWMESGDDCAYLLAYDVRSDVKNLEFAVRLVVRHCGNGGHGIAAHSTDGADVWLYACTSCAVRTCDAEYGCEAGVSHSLGAIVFLRCVGVASCGRCVKKGNRRIYIREWQ